MGLFKSKEQKNKEKLKKELKGKISTIGQGGGRSKQGTKKRLQRELKNVDKPQKEKKVHVSGAQANKRKNYGNNQTNDSSKTKSSTKVKGRKLSPYEMKKEARLQAMRDKARARHKAWKESRKKK